MKIIKQAMLVLMTICSATSLLAYANQNSCPPFVLHCAYITGLSDSISDGRYIKVANEKIGSITMCFNSTTTVLQELQDGYKLMGVNTDTYSICLDSQGSHCEQIGVDKYVVSAKDGQYNAAPLFYNIDITAIKNIYPTCDSLTGSHIKR